MARFARFLAAVFSFPFVWALCRTLFDVFSLSPADGGSVFPVESAALVAGMAAFLVLRSVLPGTTKLYVLGHELTHAVWGLAFGAKVSKLKVGESGGSVSLSKSNVWITLAPYFFPFWTMVVAAAALAVRGVMHFTDPGGSLPAVWAWVFAVGFTWCFHACFTIRSLMQRQPDVQEYGRVFSWTFILVCNIAGILVWILCTTDITAVSIAGLLWRHVVSAYDATFRAFRFVAALPAAQSS